MWVFYALGEKLREKSLGYCGVFEERVVEAPLCCGGKSSPGLVTWSWRRRVVERRHCGTESARVWIWLFYLLAV